MSVTISNGTAIIDLAVYVKSQDIANATTTLVWYLSVANAQGGYVNGTSVVAKIDGDVLYSGSGSWANGAYIRTGTYVYQHNLAGTSHTFSYSLSGSVNGGTSQTKTNSFLVTMDRGAYIDTFDDFYDTANPTFTYKNPSNPADITKMVVYCDSLNYFGEQEIPIISTSATGTYTITLTDVQRAKLRTETFLQDYETVRLDYGIITVFTDGSTATTIKEGVAVKLAKNPPTFNNPTIVDTSATAIALTGNKNTLVRYISNAQVTINAESSYGTTLTEFGVTNGSFTYVNDNPVYISPVESDTFILHAIDSRGMKSTQEIVVPFINYVKLTCNLKTGAITGTGGFDVNVTGRYFKGSFGAMSNELFVYYRYKEAGENTEYSDWVQITSITHDTANSTYTATKTITGLDYTKSYVFQAYAADIYSTVYSTERDVVSLPVFDWSETDFNFNVPVTIQGKQIGANRILWEGRDVMLANANLELQESISEQVNGIVLVFSGTGDTSWSTHYVPKEMISFYNGGGHTFLMAINAGLSAFAAKYLYISDTMITGHTTNESSGTAASSITFSNAQFFLRYVIGV